MNHLNITTAGNRNTQRDTYLPATHYETRESHQTFRKEIYSENVHEFCLVHGQVRRKFEFEKLAIPRQPECGWSLKLFLAELSKELTDEDLEMVKFLLTGTESGRETLHGASTFKVFDLLQTENFITGRDLLYLQVILAAVGKDTLINKVYKYAQNNKNILHFDPPLKSIVDEYRTDIYVTGADFHLYTEPELDEFRQRIRRIVSPCCDSRTGCTCGRVKLCISLMRLETTVGDSNFTHDDFEERRCIDNFRRPYVVCCEIGTQTEVDVRDHMILEENTRLKEQLLHAEYILQKQANEISEMKEKINFFEATALQSSEDCPAILTENECLGVIGPDENTRETRNLTVKDIEYELNAFKKEHDIQKMKLSSLSQECEWLQSKYDEVVNENNELKIEKTNTDIQVAILQRNLNELESKLKMRIKEENSLIEELRNELAMTTASLLNAQNDKRLFELSRLLEQISSMSLTVKKVYGNFDPAHEPISPKQDELFRKAQTGRIGMIFPQIYFSQCKG